MNGSVAASRSDLRRSASALTDLTVRNRSAAQVDFPEAAALSSGDRPAEHRIAAYPTREDKAAGVTADGSAVRRAVIADPEAVGIQRASARRHQLSVATTASAATGIGNSSWIIDTWLAATPPMPIHSAGAA